MSLLALERITKTFSLHANWRGQPQRIVKAVDCVSLAIQAGESLGLVGESGCGKTTLARIAMKLIPADAGSIVLQGQDITHFSSLRMRPFRPQMQMVFQDPFSSLDPRFTVRRIFEEALLFSSLSVRQKYDRARELLESVGLDGDILERFSYEFSGGQRQRLAIARALAMHPQLLILDEAVSSLDVLVQDQILDLLGDLQRTQGVTYFFISHNLRVIKKLCPQIAVMYQGQIIEKAPRESLLNNPQHPYTRHLLSAALYYRADDHDTRDAWGSKRTWTEKTKGHFVLE